MIWQNLKLNKCPNCGKDFGKSAGFSAIMIECSCGFKIGFKRMEQIISSQITKDLEEKWDQEQVKTAY